MNFAPPKYLIFGKLINNSTKDELLTEPNPFYDFMKAVWLKQVFWKKRWDSDFEGNKTRVLLHQNT